MELKIQKKFSVYGSLGYYGGRCEVFGNPEGGERIFYYDYPGMYGLCMLQDLPSGDYYFDTPKSIQRPGFYKIKFKDCRYLPILPIRLENNKTYYANGIGVGVYWFEEIQLLQDLGGEVLEIYSALLTNNYKKCLGEFTQMLNNYRVLGGFEAMCAKTLTNTFYGRLGFKPNHTRGELCYKDTGACEQDYANLGAKYLINKKFYTSNSGNVLVAAAIASKARIMLYKTMQNLINSGCRLLYCDTDCIVWAAKTPMQNLDVAGIGVAVFGENTRYRELADARFLNVKTFSFVDTHGSRQIKIRGLGVGGDEEVTKAWAAYEKNNIKISPNPGTNTNNTQQLHKRKFTNNSYVQTRAWLIDEITHI